KSNFFPSYRCRVYLDASLILQQQGYQRLDDVTECLVLTQRIAANPHEQRLTLLVSDFYPRMASLALDFEVNVARSNPGRIVNYHATPQVGFEGGVLDHHVGPSRISCPEEVELHSGGREPSVERIPTVGLDCDSDKGCNVKIADPAALPTRPGGPNLTS